MSSLLLRQLTVMDPQSPYHGQTVDVLIEDGMIKEITESLPPAPSKGGGGVTPTSGEALHQTSSSQEPGVEPISGEGLHETSASPEPGVESISGEGLHQTSSSQEPGVEPISGEGLHQTSASPEPGVESISGEGLHETSSSQEPGVEPISGEGLHETSSSQETGVEPISGEGLHQTSSPFGGGREGAYLSPGFVDLFADYREPGFEQKETIASGIAAATKGGFTDVLLLPNTHPVRDDRAGIQYVMQHSQAKGVQVHPLGAVSQGIEGKALAEMMDMRSQGAIAFTDGWKPIQSAGLMLKALEYVKAFGGIVIQVPVDNALAAGGLMHEGPNSTRLGMAGIPTLSESLMVHRDIELVRYTGSRLHITGISSAESVALVRQAKADGLDVTCSVTPYHLLLTDDALSTYDSAYKVFPPLRAESDRAALIAGLADGTIDCIASHHRPQDWDAKAKEFEYAGEGMAIQEIVLPLVLEAVGDTVPLGRIVDAMTAAPRRIFGLPQVCIDKGQPARVTIFSTEGATTFSAESAASLAYNIPFASLRLTGVIVQIVSG